MKGRCGSSVLINVVCVVALNQRPSSPTRVVVVFAENLTPSSTGDGDGDGDNPVHPVTVSPDGDVGF